MAVGGGVGGPSVGPVAGGGGTPSGPAVVAVAVGGSGGGPGLSGGGATPAVLSTIATVLIAGPLTTGNSFEQHVVVERSRGHDGREHAGRGAGSAGVERPRRRARQVVRRRPDPDRHR